MKIPGPHSEKRKKKTMPIHSQLRESEGKGKRGETGEIDCEVCSHYLGKKRKGPPALLRLAGSESEGGKEKKKAFCKLRAGRGKKKRNQRRRGVSTTSPKRRNLHLFVKRKKLDVEKAARRGEKRFGSRTEEGKTS